MNARNRAVIVSVIGIVLSGYIFASATPVSASYDGVWIQGSNGCLYQWSDAWNDYHLGACGRNDGGIDFYQNSAGWYYVASYIGLSDGSYWLYTATSGGWVLFPPAYTTSVGGSSSGRTMTGYPAIDEVLINGAYGNNQIILNGGIINCDYTYAC